MSRSETTPEPSSTSGTVRRGQLDPRKNGLNLVRLALAVTVLVSHGWYLAGHAENAVVFGSDHIGGWAVYAFFAISGYLITASRWSRGFSEFLMHRLARIYPGFVVCLLVTVVVVAPLGYVAAHGSLDGYFGTATTPASYIVGNLGLRMTVLDVAQTPADVAFPLVWNGSLWTLYFEFICYLAVGCLAFVGWVRRSRWSLVAVLVVTTVLRSQAELVASYTSSNQEVFHLLNFLPFFFAGAVVWVWRDRITFTPLGALLAAVAVAAAVAFVPGWGTQLAALPVAYVVLWVGSALRPPELLRRHDISYGFYIYAFPVQQLLAVAGLPALGIVVYDVAAILLTVPLAVASWLWVERPVMRRARRATSPAASPAAVAAPSGPTTDTPAPPEEPQPAAERPELAARA